MCWNCLRVRRERPGETKDGPGVFNLTVQVDGIGINQNKQERGSSAGEKQ